MPRCRPASPAFRLALAAASLHVAGCTPTTDLSEPKEEFGGRGRVFTTQGSAVAITGDKRIAVVTNRTDGIVSIVRLDPRKPDDLLTDRPPIELPFHPLDQTKPWAAVIGPDDDTAYVLLRNSGVGPGEVVKIVGLHSSRPREDSRVTVGSEPTSIIITPSGQRLFVANSNEGTINIIVTKNSKVHEWHVNDRLAASGFLGTSAVERRALAHPRALAMTDDGDEDDEDELI